MQHLSIDEARRLLRGALDPQQSAHWEAHLRNCAACRELVTSERAFARLLRMGDDTATDDVSTAETTVLERPLHADRLGPRYVRRRRVRFIVELAVVLGLGALLWWQLDQRHSSPAAEPAQPLHIDDDLQARVIDRLDALLVLKEEPWLAHEYEAVRMLDRFITSRKPEP